MLKIFHIKRARSFRIIWLCEEMGVPYEIAPEKFGEFSADFLNANPLGAFPAIADGDVRMFESVAIMQYVMAKYGPTPLELKPDDPEFPRYLQFLVFGEAGIAMYGNPLAATNFLCPEDKRDNWTAGYLKDALAKRAKFVADELEGRNFIVGDRFTAADITVSYALGMAKFLTNMELPANCAAYLARMAERPAYQRASAA